MEFGVSFWPMQPPEALLNKVEMSEKLGFEYVWFPDHYFLRDTFSIQALAAVRTRRIQLGTAVTSPFLRHPAAIASAAASIDELSNGRANLGIGPGGHEFAEDLKIKIDKPMAATREAVSAIRSLLKGEVVNQEGSIFRLSGAKLWFQPKRSIPIYLAARGPRMMALSGEISDGVILHGVTKPFLHYAVGKVAEGKEAASRAAETVAITVLTPVILTSQPQAARNRLKPSCLQMAGGEYSLEMAGLYGLKEEELSHLRQAMRRGDVNKATELVTDEMVDAFAIVGTNEDCLAKIDEMEKAGVTQVILNVRWIEDGELSVYLRSFKETIASRFM